MAASCSGLRRQLLSNPGRSLPAFETFHTPFFNSENQLQLSTLKQWSSCFMGFWFCFDSKPYEVEAVSLRAALATTQGQMFTERIQKRGGWGRRGFQFQGEKSELILLAYRHGDVWGKGRVDPPKKKKKSRSTKKKKKKKKGQLDYPECYSRPLQPSHGPWSKIQGHLEDKDTVPDPSTRHPFQRNTQSPSLRRMSGSQARVRKPNPKDPPKGLPGQPEWPGRGSAWP